jgi:putative transposase
MTRFTHHLRTLMQLICMLLTLLCDGMHFLLLCLRPSPALAAENLFLRKQLALHQERHVKPRRAATATRLSLIWPARCFDWRHALVLVQSVTLIRWHRQGFRLFWRWKSRPGRPRILAELQALIRQMTHENPIWGQERIANELLLKLGLRVSPRTVRKYMPKRLDWDPGKRAASQRWSTFMRNHAQAIVACDFCVVVTATFRVLTGRPHMALGPGIPQPLFPSPVPLQTHRHRLPTHMSVVAHPILGGLHHEYRLEEQVA